jgi:hypothetical protein
MPSDTKGRVKTIIMDKAPQGDSLNMQAQLGFQPGDYNELANAFNEAFDISVTAADLQPLATVQDVYTYIENL